MLSYLPGLVSCMTDDADTDADADADPDGFDDTVEIQN